MTKLRLPSSLLPSLASIPAQCGHREMFLCLAGASTYSSLHKNSDSLCHRLTLLDPDFSFQSKHMLLPISRPIESSNRQIFKAEKVALLLKAGGFGVSPIS